MQSSLVKRRRRMGSGVPRIQITTPPYLNPAAMRVGDVIQDAYVAGTYPDFEGNPVSEGARTYMVDGAPVAGTYVLQAGDLVGAATLTLTATGAPDRLIFAEPSDVTDFAYDTSDFTFVVPPGTGAGDVTAPTITVSVPSDDATGVMLGSSITVTFDEPIQFGTGTIILRTNPGTWANAETFDVVADVGAADGQVSISGNVLTINPTGDLVTLRDYAVRIAATAIEDLAGNAFAGIFNDTTISFTTEAGLAPAVYVDAWKNDGPVSPIESHDFIFPTAGKHVIEIFVMAPTNSNVVGVTVNAVAATLKKRNTTVNSATLVGLYEIDLPASGTFPIAIEWEAGKTMTRLVAGVHFVGARSMVDSVESVAVPQDLSVNTVAGDVFIAMGASDGGTATFTAAGMTEDYEFVSDSSRSASGGMNANCTGATPEAFTITPSNATGNKPAAGVLYRG